MSKTQTQQDWDAQRTDTEFGQKVGVERHTVKGEKVSMANAALKSIGEALNPRIDTYRYEGTMAVHVYLAPNIGQMTFVNQDVHHKGMMDELLAGKAIADLRGHIMTKYGHNRQVKRSGF